MTTDSLVTKHPAKFQVESLLSEGSLGPVYLARDLSLDRPISLLVVPRAIVRRPGFRERFLAAVKAAAGLYHPSIAALYEIAEHDGEFYLSAEYVPGLSLDSYLKRSAARRQAIQVDEAFFLIEQAADALVHAHAAGVAHGDIRPERLYVNRLPHPARPGEPPLRAKITGFGLAGLQQETAFDERGASSSAPPPAVSALEDVQALASVLYRMVVGPSPSAPQNGEHPKAGPPAESPFPPAVANILERTLAARPELSFQSAEELREALICASESFTAGKSRESAPVVSGVSLVTSSAAAAAVPESAPKPIATSETESLLIVSHPQQESASFRLDRPAFTIGRSHDNDIVLPAGGVSRHHLQLVSENGLWLVTDLASKNSTLVGGEIIEAHTPHIWRTGETLRIGPYTMRWLPELVELHSSSLEPQPEQTAVETSRLLMEPSSTRIQPGEQAHFGLRVFNGHPAPRRLRLAVDGIPISWLKVDSELVTLQPGSETATSLIISPPRNSASTAGRWPVVVRAILENGETERLSLPATLTVLSFVHYAGTLQPRVLRGSRTCRLILRNNGNTTTTFNIHGTSQDSSLSIVAAPHVVRLSPGETGESDLSLEVRRRPFWGPARLTRFQVEVHCPGARTLSLPGRFLLTPLLTPRRLLLSAAALVILFLLAVALINWPT